MPTVCINRPNRTKVRHFTEKDVARIAKAAHVDGASIGTIVGYVVAALGFGWVLCLAARAIDNTLTIGNALARIAGVIALGRILDFILTLLSGGVFRRLPRTNRYVLVIVLALATLEGLLRAAKSLIDDIEFFRESSSLIHEWCSAAKEYAQSAGEAVGDAWDDAADITGEWYENIID